MGFIFYCWLCDDDNIIESTIDTPNAENVLIYALKDNEVSVADKFVFREVINDPPMFRIGHEKNDIATPIKTKV